MKKIEVHIQKIINDELEIAKIMFDKSKIDLYNRKLAIPRKSTIIHKELLVLLGLKAEKK